MKLCSSIFRFILYTFIFLGASNSSYSRTTDFNYNAKNISNYFSAVVSFHDMDYTNSQKFFKKINNFDDENADYFSKLIESLVNLEKYNEAQIYSKRLERKNISTFESNLILGLYEFKKSNYNKAKFYFNKLDSNFRDISINDLLKPSLINWSEILEAKNKDGVESLGKISTNFNNFRSIQRIFADCHFEDPVTENQFRKMLKNKKSNLSRYHFFFANYLANQNKMDYAKETINLASKTYPNNLLIRQFQKVLSENENNRNLFNCKNPNHILAEILYIVGNFLSSSGDYRLSNFYINLSKYLNPDFSSYDSLLAENFSILGNYDKSKNIYKKLSKSGSVYKWYSSKKIAIILERQGARDEAVIFLSRIYKNIRKDIYKTFDLANFLREEGGYEKSIELYSTILLKIENDHEIYPEVLHRRGTAYERSNNWELAEKDLLRSLAIEPDSPYVMNYLAYTWIEKGKNVQKALRMLRRANDLKKNDGYITDSLGWALYKLNNFSEAKKYLRLAIIFMPRDPIINDHFGDCLWMNNRKIQARYYWEYALSLDSTEKELKEKIKKKLLFGLEES